MKMSDEVERLMSGLRGDHRNMALLLDLLDAELYALSASREPDYEQVRDIMLYMTEYPDAVHHPKEDIVYRHLKSLRPEIQYELERVEADHQYIEESGLRLKKDIDENLTCTILSRDDLIERLRDYMDRLREHMYWEEMYLFSLADELQHYGDWSEVVLGKDEIGDPLFGARLERRFRKLLEKIQKRIVWDSQIKTGVNRTR